MGSLDADTALVTASFDDDLGSFSGSAYVFVNTNGVWTEQQKILASDGAATHRFGNGAALEGDTVFIGAVGHDLKGDNTGATYVFSRSAGVWTQEQKLFAGESGEFDDYGHSVAIDGDTVVGGAYLSDDKGFNTGAAYVFARNNGVWSREQVLYASDPQAFDTFGTAVAVSGDTVMIGAMLTDDNGIDSGAVYVFTRSGGIWTEQQKLLASDGAAGDGFGADLALEGGTALIGAPTDDGSGSAYVFVFNGSSWIEQQKLVGSTVTADGYFGQSVSLSGDTAVVGAYLDDTGAAVAGAVYIFTRSNGVWTEQQKLTASDGADYARFGEAVSVDGDRILVGAYSDDEAANNAGAAYVFERSAGVWTERQKLFGDALSGHRFGDGVAIAGNRALVGATYALQGAYVFVESQGLWTRNEKLVPSDALSGSDFGFDVALSGDTAFIGAPGDSGNVNGSGASYVFVVTTLPNGAGCGADLECQSGHCVDSVCCDTVCGNAEQADCLACSIESGASEDGVCSPVGDNSDCSDGNACTQVDRCQSGVCVGGDPVVCDDGEVCTADSCNPANGSCVFDGGPVMGTGCDDGDACTQTDTCQSGVCAGDDPAVCDDGETCTADSCDPADGSCTFDPVVFEGNSCEDGDACTQTDTCQSGICVGSDPVVCDDGEACTTKSCNPADGSCTFDPIPLEGTDCEDGNACTQADRCQSGICVSGDPVVCDDGEACTVDDCNPADGSCIFDPAPFEGDSCEDGDACTQTDRCQSGVCVGGEPVVCDEPAECRGPGTCDPMGGECDYPVLMNGSSCSFGTCQDGVCEESSNNDAGGCNCGTAPLDGSAATLQFLLLLFALAIRRRTCSRG